MKLVRRVSILFSVLLLVACSGANSSSEVEALNKAEAIGSPFTQFLAREYRDYANNEQHKNFDYPDALHFARKGLAAANGETVMPETLDDWDLPKNKIIEMEETRLVLVTALENGGREVAPEVAAIAQARFDCWVEHQEEDWKMEKIADCKTQFLAALDELTSIINAQQPEPEPQEFAPPAPIAAPVAEVEPEDVPLEQAMFIVFFDWDKSSLTSGANDVLAALTEEVMSRDDVTSIVVTGHTDSSGPTKYNEKLSMKRAQAVKDGLVARGIAPTMVRVQAHGENDLLVKTADNVREPANRRVEIGLE